MEIFQINEEKMKNTSSTYTINEIYQQPKTWKKTCNQIQNMSHEINAFIEKITSNDDYDIILTGAGTSEFVGNSLYSWMNKKYNFKVKSFGTTDIVASPENYLSRTKPTLLISFGRSGNSPESVAAIDVAEEVCENIYHLFITCNKEGALSKRAKEQGNCLAINLTDETHDQSFAMTSSFSNMYLACYLCFNLERLEHALDEINFIIEAGQSLLDRGYNEIEKIVQEFNFSRIVYLGSNCLKGVAQESALKMLELSAGEVVTMFDTPLGFRHGPKSIVDDTTLTVIYISDNEYTRQYELDLIKEMSAQRKGNKLVAVLNQPVSDIDTLVDYVIPLNVGGPFDNCLLGLDYILIAQVMAVFKSLSLNITPDNPCPTGEVNRVVQGVTLYPYKRGN